MANSKPKKEKKLDPLVAVLVLVLFFGLGIIPIALFVSCGFLWLFTGNYCGMD